VIAVGYGTTRRRDVTGAIASVSAENLMVGRAAPTVSVAGALVGRAPGVQVVSNLATPGASASIRIRGVQSITASSEPLYVVDGIPLGIGAGNAIDPTNIESIQILKDASSTAIYGARGANGVVLITTKRGARGGNQIVLESSYGYQRPSKFIPVLTGPEYRALANEASINAGLAPRYTPVQVDGAETYDYPRMMLRDLRWQPQQSHALTLSGGDQQSRYLLSGNYLQQTGLMINSDFERFGSRLNLDRDINDRFRVGTSLSGTYSVRNVNTTESTAGLTGDQTRTTAGITGAMQFDPSLAPKDSLGNWIKTVTLGATQPNPLANAVEIRNPNHHTALLATMFGEYDLAQGLRLRSTVGGNFNFSRSPYYAPSTIDPGNNEGVARQTSGERRELTNENTLTYNRELGPGSLDLLLGGSIQTSQFLGFQAQAQGFLVDNLQYNNLGVGTTLLAPSSEVAEWTLLSALGRANYNLLNRYLFTVTARRDGSSRFGANNKWALFPSGAFAWRVIDEPFMFDQRLFSDLKFRVSYGRTGNQAITEYQSLARLTTAFLGLGTSTEHVSLVPEAAAPNPDLKWETQDQYNVGIDLAFLDNRVVLTADAYQSNTSNLLLNVNLPFRTGYTTQLQNVGAVRNRGTELSLNTTNVDGSRFWWGTTLNVSANRNQVTQLYGGLQDLGAGSGTRVGHPLNTIVGHKVLGLWQAGDTCTLINRVECTPGEYRILDANDDGVIDDNDRVILGSPQATFYGGFTNQIRYGPLTLDAFLNFSLGNQIHNQSLRFIGLSAGFLNERSDLALNRWTPANTNTLVPRANLTRNNSRAYSTHVEDGSFVRLQNLSVGYDLPAARLPGASAARLILTGQNLWTATKYRGYDPEQGAVDLGGYPRARAWNLGVSATF
jgi:TonB-dependent starch-binding outer membrane protein SusC